jgi:uncharacterized membrane protein
MIKNFFTEKDGVVSWRKIMTAGAVFCFMLAVIGFEIKNDFTELPTSYQAIIAGVFVFYFGKELISKTKITTE